MMQRTFELKKPTYEIYAEVFAIKQDEYIPIDIVIRRKQALLVELPRPHPEYVQIDMIYSLLKSQIKNKVPRESVASFDQLIPAAQRVEQSKNDKRVKRLKNNDFKAMRLPAKLK